MKKIFVCLLAFVLLFVLSGCNTADINSTVKVKENVKDEELKEAVYVCKITSEFLFTFQDPKTGVWYYFGDYTGITPRFNRDGSLYTGD